MRSRTPKTTQRLRSDTWIRKAFAAGVPATTIARRHGKTLDWVYKRLRAMGCPASSFGRTAKRSADGSALP